MNLWIGAAIITVLGISMLCKAKDWVRWFEALERQGHCGSLNAGLICLLLGGYILATPGLWHGMAALLAVLGMIIFLKGTFYLLSPSVLPSRLCHFHQNLPSIIRLAGLVSIALGIALFNAWIDIINAENLRFIRPAH